MIPNQRSRAVRTRNRQDIPWICTVEDLLIRWIGDIYSITFHKYDDAHFIEEVPMKQEVIREEGRSRKKMKERN